MSQGVSSKHIPDASGLQRRCLAICGCVPKTKGKATSFIFIQYNVDLFVEVLK